jgi:hypothetical protein
MGCGRQRCLYRTAEWDEVLDNFTVQTNNPTFPTKVWTSASGNADE